MDYAAQSAALGQAIPQQGMNHVPGFKNRDGTNRKALNLNTALTRLRNSDLLAKVSRAAYLGRA